MAENRSFVHRTLRVVGVVTAVVVTLWLLLRAADVFLLIFAAVLVAEFLYSLAGLLSQHTSLSYSWSLAVVVTMLVGITLGGFWLWAPRLIQEATQLIDTLPQTLEHARQQLMGYSWGRELLQYLPPATTLMPVQGMVLSRITGIFSTALSILTSLLIILFAGLYLALDPQLYQSGLVRLVPVDKRDHARYVLNLLGYNLRWWLVGRLSSMLIIAALTTAGLWLLGMPLALVLGLLAGLLEYIPNFGPLLAAIPAVLIALTQGTNQLISVLVLYLAVQAIESYLITPLILKRAVSLPPMVTIAALVFFGVLFGFLGLLFATPLAAVVMVLVQVLYVRDTLGDDSIQVVGEAQPDKRE